MKINLTSFLLGIIFTLSFFIFSGGVFTPKKIKVNSIEIIDDGDNHSGYLIIRNSEGNIVSYLGSGKNNRGLLTLKDQNGDTKINIGSNNSGGYFKANNLNNNESIYLNSN